MRALLDPLERDGDPRRYFLGTYLRTTEAVADAITGGLFEDRPWVEEWDVDFASLYLDAVEAFTADPSTTPRPWRIAFTAAADLPPEAHVLLGMNAHINFDLPQSLLRVISPAEFADPAVMAARERDHERVDEVLARRVAAEDAALEAAGGRRTPLDRVLAPVNRLASRRFLRRSREQVWHNAVELDAARRSGPDLLGRRLADLDTLAAARVADLLRPGAVLVRLAVRGFGVTLPPP
jgi:hypothetical protein